MENAIPRVVPFGKVLVFGNGGSGKSALIERWKGNEAFSERYCCPGDRHVSHAGVVESECDRLPYRFSILEAPSCDRRGHDCVPYDSTTRAMRGLFALVWVVDLSDSLKPSSVQKWIRVFQQHSPEDAFRFVVGNKVDRRDSSSVETLHRLLEPYLKSGYLVYAEVSCKTGAGTAALFRQIAEKRVYGRPILVESGGDPFSPPVASKTVASPSACSLQ